MSHHRHHHRHHLEWWLAPIYAYVLMAWACLWILRLYAYVFIYAWKGIQWAAPRITAAWRSWRNPGGEVPRELGRF